jgi:uncharacterized membrane protein YphA (DoxX/SURF4 family)
LPKVADPPAFAKAMVGYALFPGWSIPLLALALPWLELLCGLALCLGLWARAAASWLAALLLAFGVALGINLARHHPVDCGCFSTQETAASESERLDGMRWAILRDLGLLLLAAQVLVAGTRSARD